MLKKHKILPLVLIISSFIIIVSIVSISLSKYVKKENNSAVIVSPNFVFVSNYENGQTYELNRNSVQIVVKNKDVSGINNSNINFDILIREVGQSASKESFTNQELISGQESSKTFNFTNLTSGKTYEVVISSTSPVKKTITHKFIILNNESIPNYYTLIDNGFWIELDIYIGSECPNSITINYSDKLSADNNNDYMSDWFSNNGVIDNLSENSHYNLKFFKNDNTTYLEITDGVITGNQITIS